MKEVRKLIEIASIVLGMGRVRFPAGGGGFLA